MKKLLSILTLGVLLFSNITPSFTYAVDIEEVSTLLESFLQSTNNNQQENNENIFQQNNNHVLKTLEDETGEDEIELIGNDPHIIWNKTKGEITIYTGDFSYGITLEDKNLGAQNVGETGLYYQWGNNHGNPSNSAYTSERLEYNTNWDNNGYSGEETKFIGFNYYPNYGDIWELIDNNGVSYPNLRGGGNDNTDYGDNGNINLGYNKNTHKATNIDGRKGPCNYGYHIPSAGEWSELIRIYAGIKNLETSINTYNGSMKLIDSRNGNFKDDLKLIYGGLRDYNTTNGMAYYGDSGLYRSSTPVLTQSTNNYYSYATYIGKNINSVENISTYNTYPRANGQSIRCFKNEYVPYELKVKFNPNGGAFSGMDVNVIKTYEYQTNENGIIPIYNIQIPDRESEDMSQQSGWMFAGWYTKDGTNSDWGEEFDISNPQTTVAYAKWLKFNDLKLNFGGHEFVIMDRNIGAKEKGDGIFKGYSVNDYNTNMFGKYFQWGNNYGFDLHANTATKKTINKINGESFGPNNKYYNNTFIKVEDGLSHNRTIKNNNNLRGGEYSYNSDVDKQGPCPNGYHIPDREEWETLISYFKIESDKEGFCEESNIEGYSDNRKLADCFSKKIFNVYAGNLNKNSAVLYNNHMGFYRTSTPFSSRSNYIQISERGISFDKSYNEDRSYGYQIRCFSNQNPIRKLTIKDGLNIKEYLLKFWEDDLSYLYTPEKPGYKFIGWFYDSTEGTPVISKKYSNEDSVIVARWEPTPKYNYNTNGGMFLDQSTGINVYYNKYTKYSYSENLNESLYTGLRGSQPVYPRNSIDTKIITITGAKKLDVSVLAYMNQGWNYVAIWEGKHSDYIADENAQNLEGFKGIQGGFNDRTYHNYLINGDSVTFGLKTDNSSSGPGYGYFAFITGDVYTSSNGDYLSSMQLEEIPSRPGYSFSGWYETGVLEPFNFTGTKIDQNRTLYAKWNPHHYKIQFNINGGTGVVNDKNATYGEEINLPNVTREGYTFRGWLSDAGVLYNNVVPEGTGVTTEDGVIVTLTAQWELIPVITPSAGGGQSITPTKQETKVREQEHNSADTENQKTTNTQTNTSTNNVTAPEEIKQQVKKVEDRYLTRGEVAIMTNILLEVYPQLVEGKTELDDVTNACSNYADEQNFTKDEKKAITRLCKLSIMGIHNETYLPLEEFLVDKDSTNDEFATVINRSIETYNEKDLSTIKDALKKLEGDEENVVFGTVYDMFMSIKNIFN